jgi:hypothetical protein
MSDPGARRPPNDVAGTDLVLFALGLLGADGGRPELERPGAFEDDEDLLVRGMEMWSDCAAVSSGLISSRCRPTLSAPAASPMS